MFYQFFFLLFGALILSVSEGEFDNTIAEHHNNLPKISDRHNPAHNVIPNPSLPGSSAKVICKNPCQKGWISYKGRCYKLIQERMTWNKAEETCLIERAGSHLTSITSEEENEFLRRLSQGQKETQLWTGGTYQKASGSLLKWSDGSLTTFIQRPLSSIFSSVRRLINNLFNIKFCLSLSIGGQGEWDGANCGKKLPFICVYKPNLKQ
ncbi:PGCA protein, partial [Asarcornis scutulata]|nr:PGCA protein [Asarcornis scutulata]